MEQRERMEGGEGKPNKDRKKREAYPERKKMVVWWGWGQGSHGGASEQLAGLTVLWNFDSFSVLQSIHNTHCFL